MATSTPDANPSPSTTKANTKSNRSRKLLVTLKLSPASLAKFPSDQPPRKSSSRSKPQPAATSTPHVKKTDDSTLVENPSESNATPASNNASDDNPTATATNGVNDKEDSTPKIGQKRSASDAGADADANTNPKQRSKPGPKRRKADAEANATVKTPWTGPPPISNHKLGPKANQGAINAGLRALDRTGKPCRKWSRKGFQLKSFTGVAWSMPSWRTPQVKDASLTGDVKSETTGSSEEKIENSSSMVGSEKSNNGVENTASSLPPETASTPPAVENQVNGVTS